MKSRIILAPDYTVAKAFAANNKVALTVEAEYGDEVIEGQLGTLAHHGKRQSNPAPCNWPDVPQVNNKDYILISHIDLDTVGGILAAEGIKPVDKAFWDGAEYIDINGRHHMGKLSTNVQNQLNAVYAWMAMNPVGPYRETIDVSQIIEDYCFGINSIINETGILHDLMIEFGKVWNAKQNRIREECLVREFDSLRVFCTKGVSCAAAYYSPEKGRIIPATLTLDQVKHNITLAFEDGGKQHSAVQIMQEIFGDEAGGKDGIAGTPYGIDYNMRDLMKTAETLVFNELK